MALLVGTALLFGCGGSGGLSGGNQVNQSSPSRDRLSGVISDRNGVPVSGVTVTLYYNNSNTTATATTDSSGAYSFPDLYNNQYSDYAVYAEKSGFAFYPSVADPAGKVMREDFNGNYRTVIRFLTMPSHDVTGADFTAYRPGDRLASLPSTGEAASYAVGDDYAVRAGVAWPATRFTDNQDGTATDNLTGLVWLKNAGCFPPADWMASLANANQLASGQCGLVDGSLPGQWRMPNVNELESLVDVSRAAPSLPAGAPFTNVAQGNAYWSSTTYMAGIANALAIRFTDGRWINGQDAGDGSFSNTKTSSSNSVWAVKSGGNGAVKLLATGLFSGQGGGSGISFGTGDDPALQLGIHLTSPRFVDNGNGTLSDTVTGLTWLKKADCISGNWSGSLTAVNALSSGQCGLTDGSAPGDWRMPNRNEMLSLADRAPTFPIANYFNGIPGPDGVTVTFAPVFQSFQVFTYYWTSTSYQPDPGEAWSVYSCDFGVYNHAKSAIGYALAVR
ncbi:hypothetical protein GMSM_14030 [Geomonas sp. Red276]